MSDVSKKPKAPAVLGPRHGKPPLLYATREEVLGLMEAYRALLTTLVHEEGPARRAKLLSLLAVLEGMPRGK